MINKYFYNFIYFFFFVLLFSNYCLGATYLDVPQSEYDCLSNIIVKFNLVKTYPLDSNGKYSTLCVSYTTCYNNGSIQMVNLNGKTESVPSGVYLTASDFSCFPYMNRIYIEQVPTDSSNTILYYPFPYVTQKSFISTNFGSTINQIIPPLTFLQLQTNYQATIYFSSLNNVSGVQLYGIGTIGFTIIMDDAADGSKLNTVDGNFLNFPRFDKYYFSSIIFTLTTGYNGSDVSNFQYLKANAATIQYLGNSKLPFIAELNRNISYLTLSTYFQTPTRIYDLSTFTNYYKIKISTKPDFYYNNQIPVIVSPVTNFEISMSAGTIAIPLLEINSIGANKSAIYYQVGYYGDLPVYTGKGAAYGYPNNKLTGTIDKSWCGTNLIVSNNQLTGTIPSCFTCYFNTTSFSSFGISAPIEFYSYIAPTMYNRFSGNLFTNYNKSIPCTTYKPYVRPFNSSAIIISGQDIGFEVSQFYVNSTITNCISNVAAYINLGYEYICNTQSRTMLLASYILLGNNGNGINYYLPLVPNSPSIKYVNTLNNQVFMEGTHFSSYFGQYEQNVTIDGTGCQVSNTAFLNLTCTTTVASSTRKLITVTNNGYSKRVYAIINSGVVNSLTCPNDCVNDPNGDICDLSTGKCAGCPKNCSGFGQCDLEQGKCICDSSHQSLDCSLPYKQCPINNGLVCSGFGSCNNQTGVCTCDASHQSSDCSLTYKQCPINGGLTCNGFGSCNNQTGVCTCDGSHQSSDCSLPYKQCPIANNQLCAGSGSCNNQTGICTCDGSHQSSDCSLPYKQCPINGGLTCNGFGSCNNQTGVCACDGSHQSSDCSLPFVQCPISNNQLCAGSGSCNNQTGICTCDASHQSSDCSLPFKQCPINGGLICSGLGSCNNQTSICTCNSGRTLSDCSGIQCSDPTCSGNGNCNTSTGKCQCNSSFQGSTCSVPFVQCPIVNNQLCAGSGSCNNQTGICACNASHQSSDCSIPFIKCPLDSFDQVCSASGTCNNVTGLCTCDTGRTLNDCSGYKCDSQNGCNSNGDCDFSKGVCNCYDGWQSSDCSVPFIECPSVDGKLCSGFGQCNNATGFCTCDSSHQSSDCSLPYVPCLNDCTDSSHGTCDTLIGVCNCNLNYQSSDCSVPFIQCPIENGQLCSNNGQCNNVTGSCTCESNYQSSDCSVPFIQCPIENGHLCSNNGKCNNVTGSCTCESNYQSSDCSVPFIPCLDNSCSNQGVCNNVTGVCVCKKGYQGSSCENFEHYITAVFPSNEDGGEASFVGKFGDKHDQLSVKIGKNDCPVTFSSSSMINCTALPGKGIYNVNITQNNIVYIGNNIYQYIEIENQTIQCPNNCSNHGKCNESTGFCFCNEGYSSYDCNSLVGGSDNSTKTPPNTNIDDNTGGVDINNQKVNFNIYLRSLNEVDVNGNIVKNYSLIKDWSVNKTVSNIYVFEQSPNNDDFKVISTIEQVSSDKEYSFAGVDFLLEKNSIKYTISVQNYKYQSFLNTLQLEMVSAVIDQQSNNDDCNTKDSNVDSNYFNNQNNINYIKLTKNNVDFVGRFINKVVSDSRSTFLSSTLKNESNNTVIVTLNLPHCVNECLIDPDFSVLLNSDFSDCKSPNENIKWKIPVAVVVGVVGAGCIGVFFYNRNKFIKFNGKKISTRGSTL